ncbi:MAG: TonB-dependent receptor [Rikenellaceae bacterium]|jgi:TonB-linked SusC/RagA family outer membrane protein|nr:TonB-dependent receptor [Rikenellaceae bacterium]
MNQLKFKLTILLSLVSLCVSAQNIAVQGVVTDQNGEPLIAASVVENQNPTNATITSATGAFTLSVPRNAVITISYIGYTPQEVTVTGSQPLAITLEEDAARLEDVVVIGYGTQRREAVTGSVASIQSEALQEVPAHDITYALQGRIAGLEMSQTSTSPGANMQIRIRGTRSLSGNNDPLVVLDGIPFAGSLSDINPGDIKSMDILKDASSTAIYGSRGANGVIMITTFKGMKRTPARVRYSGYYGLKDVFGRYPMMEGEEYAKMRAYAGKYVNTLDEADTNNTDWQDLFYRTGVVTQHSVNVSGGTDGGSYNFGGGYYLDQALIPTNQFERYSINASVDQKVGKYLRFGLTNNTSYNQTDNAATGMYSILQMSPILNPYNEDGSLKRMVKMPNDDAFVWTRDVIEGLGDGYANETKALATYSNLFAELSIPKVEGLTYRINLGLNYRQDNNGGFTGIGVGNALDPNAVSSGSQSYRNTTNYVVENLLTFDRTFAEKHHVTANAMYSAEQTRMTYLSAGAREIPADFMQYYNLGQGNNYTLSNSTNPGSLYSLRGLVSWMGRVMYQYDNKYMLSVSVRGDGASVLAEGHKWFTYPAVSAGWNINREAFMQDVKWIDVLKLRVGYGSTANQAINPYTTLGTLNTRTYNFGDTYGMGYYINTSPNPDLTWESTQSWNFGLDFTLFGGRLTGTAEYYMQYTNGLLQGVNLPSTSGVTSQMANVGKTQNKGFELTLNGKIIENNNGWSWDLGFNLYTNKNKITWLKSGSDRDEGNGWFVGFPVNAIYAHEKIGLWQAGDPYLDILEPGGNVGMVKVKYLGEYNADGTPVRAIGSDDRIVRSADPKLQGGFNTSVRWKNLDFTMVGAFKVGGILVSTLYSGSGYLNMLTGRRGQVKVDYWTEDNTDAKYPRPGGVQSGDNPKYSDLLGYFDASYLKVRAMTLGYNFEGLNWVRRNLGVQQLRVYATVQNPFVLFSPYHKESGMDPETNSYGNQNVAVAGSSRQLIIGTNAPSTRNYIFGLNLTF